MEDKLKIGGQALIEGVMIKSNDYVSVAIRKDDGKIKTKVERFKSYTKKNKFFSLPFIRGIVVLIEMLYIGMKELIYTANEQSEEDEKESLSAWNIIFTIAVSLLFALVLFKAVPLLLAKYIIPLFGIKNVILFNLIDGLIRITIFIIYLLVISTFKDVKIMFQYHGAEHASISCYEHGEKLTVKNVKKYSTIHPRCGTSFLMLTLFVSIIMFSVVSIDYPYWKLLLLRLPLVLPIAGISYELLKIGDKKRRSLFVRIITAPGMWVQRITTRKPDEKQIEVAIAAVEELRKKHKVEPL
jgi:uncharacterized protein YqhQ